MVSFLVRRWPFAVRDTNRMPCALETEVGVVLPQTKECLNPEAGRVKKGPLEALVKAWLS